jgi:hypothetical protein
MKNQIPLLPQVGDLVERVEQQEVSKILSSDPHWIGGGFLLQCLLLLQMSIHLSLLANQLATSLLPLLLLLLLS